MLHLPGELKTTNMAFVLQTNPLTEVWGEASCHHVQTFISRSETANADVL